MELGRGKAYFPGGLGKARKWKELQLAALILEMSLFSWQGQRAWVSGE